MPPCWSWRRATSAWPSCCFLLLLLLLLYLAHLAGAATGDAEALLTLMSSLDRSDHHLCRPDAAPTLYSSWPDMCQCDRVGRVTKLVLEGLNLIGSLTAALLAPLAELRVLSLKSNALLGPIPDLTQALPNIKLLYLADNRLGGHMPPSLGLLHHATILVLSGNSLTGQIPGSKAALPRHTSLPLDKNLLTSTIPVPPQRTMRTLNVSANRLSRQIPAVLATRFNA